VTLRGTLLANAGKYAINARVQLADKLASSAYAMDSKSKSRLTRRPSLHSDHDCIARAADVSQSNRTADPGLTPLGMAEVDL